MQIAFRVAATSLAGLQTAVTAALASFFGEIEYTYQMLYAQGDETFDEEGKPVRYQADVQAQTV